MSFTFRELFLQLPDDVVREHIYKTLFAENFPVIKSISTVTHMPDYGITIFNEMAIYYSYCWLNYPLGTGWGCLKYNSENIDKREFIIF